MKDDSLIALFCLTDYFAVEVKDRIFPNGDIIKDGDHIKIKTAGDYAKVFERQFKLYIEANQFSDRETFIQVQKDYLTEKIEQIKQLNKYHELPEYKHSIHFINNYLTPINKSNGLFNELVKPRFKDDKTGKEHGYISGDTDTFNYVMTHKRLSGSKKLDWLTYKSDAIFFADQFGFTPKQLNDCFTSNDNKPFHAKNRPEKDPKPPLHEIINKFSDRKTDLETA